MDNDTQLEVHEVEVQVAPDVTVKHSFIGDAEESVVKFIHNGMEHTHVLKRDEA